MLAWVLASGALLLGLLFIRRDYWAWVASGGLLLVAWGVSGVASLGSFLAVGLAFGALALLVGRPAWRCRWIPRLLMPRIGRVRVRVRGALCEYKGEKAG